METRGWLKWDLGYQTPLHKQCPVALRNCAWPTPDASYRRDTPWLCAECCVFLFLLGTRGTGARGPPRAPTARSRAGREPEQVRCLCSERSPTPPSLLQKEMFTPKTLDVGSLFENSRNFAQLGHPAAFIVYSFSLSEQQSYHSSSSHTNIYRLRS